MIGSDDSCSVVVNGREPNFGPVMFDARTKGARKVKDKTHDMDALFWNIHARENACGIAQMLFVRFRSIPHAVLCLIRMHRYFISTATTDRRSTTANRRRSNTFSVCVPVPSPLSSVAQVLE